MVLFDYKDINGLLFVGNLDCETSSKFVGILGIGIELFDYKTVTLTIFRNMF
jgi:hypothetical protein